MPVFQFDQTPPWPQTQWEAGSDCHSLTYLIILNPHRRERREDESRHKNIPGGKRGGNSES